MRGVLAFVVWILCMMVLAAVCLFAMVVLAGPHSSLLPGWAQPVVLILGWLVLAGGGVWLGRVVWRRIVRRERSAVSGAVES
ncbi:MAG: hypothetical protein HOP28_09395 [Gemmatimonadales bacterium]|nr:hypothetical protein [Gemmatimonadales bacterium]